MQNLLKYQKGRKEEDVPMIVAPQLMKNWSQKRSNPPKNQCLKIQTTM